MNYNAGETCGRCGAVIHEDDPAERFSRMVDGTLSITIKHRADPCPKRTSWGELMPDEVRGGEFEVGQRVRLTTDRFYSGRAWPREAVTGDIGEVIGVNTNNLLVTVEWNTGTSSAVEQYALEILEPATISDPLAEWERQLLGEVDRDRAETRQDEARRHRRIFAHLYGDGTMTRPHHSENQYRDRNGRFAAEPF